MPVHVSWSIRSGDKALQLRWILDAVLGLPEDETEQSGLLAELAEELVVVRLEVSTVLLSQ